MLPIGARFRRVQHRRLANLHHMRWGAHRSGICAGHRAAYPPWIPPQRRGPRQPVRREDARMLGAEDNGLLCRVEGDAPMGQIMRRHWLPACLSQEVADRDGAPVPVRLLGEDLVAFRDTDGRLGVVGAHCPHRRVSLALGRNEECGLRCLYHGWKVDVDGNILEMASEPPGSRITDKVKHKAYPAHEAAGFIWTYMGPADTMPAFEPPAFAPTAKARVSTVK